jgi:Na+/proline symporter/signal transduction histidine kinase
VSDLAVLITAAVAYLGLLAFVASAAERGIIPRALTHHPVVYVFGLCVYDSTWGYYGNVGFANTDGYMILAASVGATLLCLLVPVVWVPLLRLTRNYQLPSVADLFAFRYRSSAVGVAVTLVMLAGSLPYLAQQIQGVTESVRHITRAGDPHVIGLAFCAALTGFALLFGHRHTVTGERNDGLSAAIAFESVMKIGVALIAAGVAIMFVFQSPSGLARWVQEHPQKTAELMEPLQGSSWSSLVLFACTAVFMHPRTYHMAFAEAPDHAERALAWAAWMFPLLRILSVLPIPVLLWAGAELAPGANPDFHALRIAEAAGGRALTTLVFIGGVSAASAMVIVTTLALGTMSLNNLFLPLLRPRPERNLYAFVRWGRRSVTAAIILLAYAVFVPLAGVTGRLVDFGGFVAFVSVVQFAPGMIGVLFWKRATARGVLAGLAGGVTAWLVISVVPLFIRSGELPAWLDLAAYLGVPPNGRFEFELFFSVAFNVLLFATVSLARAPTQDEEDGARACAEMGDSPLRGEVVAASPAEIRAGLEPVIGSIATSEVERALQDLALSWEERRPIQLLRLRNQLERNLSGQLGPVVARVAVEEGVRVQRRGVTTPGHLVDLERRIAASHESLGGLASELYEAQRYLRSLLDQLPIGVCVLGPDGKVAIWNRVLAKLAKLTEQDVATFSHVADLPAPWGRTLAEFSMAPESQLLRVSIATAEGQCVVNLGKSASHWGGQLLVIEDLTESIALRDRLAHKERLAWLGERVALIEHEIQTPVVAILALAQNLRREVVGPGAREGLARIVERTRDIEAKVRSGLMLSRGPSPEGPACTVAFSAAEMLRDAIDLVRDSDESRAFPLECPDDLRVCGEQPRVTQAVVNLLRNACDASQPGADVQIRASLADCFTRIEVRDRGAGMSPELWKQIQRGSFVTTKLPGHGTGLGLPQTLEIARAHGGTLEITSRDGEGTIAALYLPAPNGGGTKQEENHGIDPGGRG